MIYGEGTVCVPCMCTRENISPISGCRVSGYAQRVITLSWRTVPLRFAYVHAVCFYLLPLPRVPICSFAGRPPLHLPHTPTMHPCDARFYSLARLQRQRNTIRPARKWRNYIRERVEERKSQTRSNGACESWMRSLASAENVVRKGVSKISPSFLPSLEEEDENLEDAVVRSLLHDSGRIIFHSFCLKSLAYS